MMQIFTKEIIEFCQQVSLILFAVFACTGQDGEAYTCLAMMGALELWRVANDN